MTPAALYDWLLFGHLIAAMVWVGGLAGLLTQAVAILRGGGAEGAVRFVAGLRLIGPRLLLPAMASVVGLGIWLVADSEAWGFDQLWIQLGLGLFIAAFVLGAAHQSRAALAAERAAEAGDLQAVSRHLSRWAWGTVVIVGLLAVATWDMVFKPGL
jgi:uncharacterized membrane protein